MKLLKNLNLLRPCSKKPFLENAFILIEGDEFKGIDTEEPEGEFEEVLDFGGKYALPGLINGHHHLYSSLALGMPPPSKIPGNSTWPWTVIRRRRPLNRDCSIASKPGPRPSSTITAVLPSSRVL